jgi:hypothetical protein
MPSKTEGEALDNVTDGPRRGSRSRGGLERITVNLTPRTLAALELAVEITGDIKTDAINRAIQIYAYLEQVIEAGGSIHVRESAGAELERLKIVG